MKLKKYVDDNSGSIPSWTLSALYDLLPYSIEEQYTKAKYKLAILKGKCFYTVSYIRKWELSYTLYTNSNAKLFDALCQMIVTLKKNKNI